jgi:hypothetical protein
MVADRYSGYVPFRKATECVGRFVASIPVVTQQAEGSKPDLIAHLLISTVMVVAKEEKA